MSARFKTLSRGVNDLLTTIKIKPDSIQKILQEGELDYTGCLTGGTGWMTLIKLLPVTNFIFSFRAAITEKYKYIKHQSNRESVISNRTKV